MKLSSVILFSSRRRHTRYWRDWSSDVCSSDLLEDGHHEREGGHRLLAAREQQDALEALARWLRDQVDARLEDVVGVQEADRKSTRLNSSHANISYAVFCLKKKKKHYRSSTILR